MEPDISLELLDQLYLSASAWQLLPSQAGDHLLLCNALLPVDLPELVW